MANETTLHIIGNLTADPELRYTQNGLAVANFTIASTPRTFDRTINDWKDGDALFLRCAAWRDLAEHIAGSLTKGTRVVATGFLKTNSYETKDGERRTSLELDVQDVGPSLRYATAQVTRSAGGHRQERGTADSRQASQDVWNQPQQDQWNAPGSYDDDTPF